METFSVLLAFCAGNSPVAGEFPTQRPVTHKMFPFDDVIMIKHDFVVYFVCLFSFICQRVGVGVGVNVYGFEHVFSDQMLLFKMADNISGDIAAPHESWYCA